MAPQDEVLSLSAIVFDRVSKVYQLGNGHRSLYGLLSRTLGRRDKSEDEGTEFWALRDVSFSVDPGETVGIIGSNGAGKTTSLKIMSRVSWPTVGNVGARGRIAALIELGAGFHPELTGRENVYLNGAILGMSQAEIRRQYSRIVSFAELERFMDTPVKRYSSGMFARLGFAVAAHVDPDVLLVDEVLAVGDVNFQRKCFDFIQDFVRSGRTTVFVSHNLYALEQLCDRLIWLDRGQIVHEGGAAEVLTAYMDAQDRELRKIERYSEVHGVLSIDNAVTCDTLGLERESFSLGQDIVVRLDFHARQVVARPHFVLAIWDAATRQPITMASMLVDGQVPAKIDGFGSIICKFLDPPLMPRTYHIWGEVYAEDRRTLLVRWQPLAAFIISGVTTDSVTGSGSLRHLRADAPVRTTYDWEVCVGERKAR